MNVVKVGKVLVKAEFVVEDGDGNVIASPVAPEALIHWPHETNLGRYLAECVARMEGQDGQEDLSRRSR